jgi:DNA-directed RNA polymerase specialized sigma24 family protein
MPETGDPHAAIHLDAEDVRRSWDDERRWLDTVAQSMPRVRAYIRRVSMDGDEIADLLAETRALAWFERAELLADQRPIDAMIRHAREACRKWVMGHRREVAVDEAHCASTSTEETPGSGAMSVEAAVEWQRWSERVLGRLSPQQRLTVDYRYRWSWDYDYVAAATGSTEAAARINAHRGLRRLRAIIANDPPPVLAREDV